MTRPSEQHYYPWHRRKGAGLAFRQWLTQDIDLLKQEPVSLKRIDATLQEEFAFGGQKDWQEAMVLSIAELLRLGYRTALYRHDSKSCEWTDRFNWPDEFGEGQEGVAAAALQSWLAFGDSGGAEDLRLLMEFKGT